MAQMSQSESRVKVASGEYTLVLNLGAAKRIEQHYDGASINTVFAKLGDDMDMEALQVVIWAALWKHHKLTLDDVDDLICIGDLQAWAEGLMKLIPKAEVEEGADHPQKAKAG